MKVTSKGQVTIPIHVREHLGIRPGTEVGFEIVDGEVRLRVVAGPGPRGRDLVEAMRGRASTGLETDEILELTRGDE